MNNNPEANENSTQIYYNLFEYSGIENANGEIDFNLTKLWLENVFQQIALTNNNVKEKKRPILIEIDLETSNSSKYLISLVRSEIHTSFELFSSQLKILFMCIYAILILLGLFSNSFVIYAFCRSKSLRTFRNFFIINLSISDILLSSVCAPLTLFKFLNINWPLGRFLCKLGPSLQTIISITSALSITSIAIDRWINIVHSKRKTRSRPKRHFIHQMIAFIWSLAVLISIPSFVINDQRVIQIKSTGEVLYSTCEEIWFDVNTKYAFCLITISFQYLVPVLVVTMTYYRICNFLQFQSFKSNKNRPRFDSNTQSMVEKDNLTIQNETIINDNNKSVTRQKSVTFKIINKNQSRKGSNQATIETDLATNFNTDSQRSLSNIVRRRSNFGAKRYERSKNLLILVSLTFVICWFPLFCLNLFLDLAVWSEFSARTLAIVFLSFHLLAISTCTINPILYGLQNNSFKKEFAKILSQAIHSIFAKN